MGKLRRFLSPAGTLPYYDKQNRMDFSALGNGAALAAVSGVAYAGMGVGYRAGHAHRIGATQVVLAVCLPGAVFFGLRAHGVPIATVPTIIWIAAAAAGAGQFVSLKLFSRALALGSLSLAWCGINLGYFLTILYSHFRLGEDISSLGYVGLAAAFGCVVAASLGLPVEQTSREAKTSSLRARDSPTGSCSCSCRPATVCGCCA